MQVQQLVAAKGKTFKHFICKANVPYTSWAKSRDYTIVDLDLYHFAGPDLQAQRGIANGALGAFAGYDQMSSVPIVI